VYVSDVCVRVLAVSDVCVRVLVVACGSIMHVRRSDLHSSTSTVLEWLLQQRMLRVGSLIGYDDWWTIPCNHHRVARQKARLPKNGQNTKSTVLSPLKVGEGLAHAEVTRKYGLRFLCLAGPCRMPPSVTKCHVHNNWAPVFMLTAIGATGSDTGFSFTPKGMNAWMAHYPVCHKVHDM